MSEISDTIMGVIGAWGAKALIVIGVAFGAAAAIRLRHRFVRRRHDELKRRDDERAQTRDA